MARLQILTPRHLLPRRSPSNNVVTMVSPPSPPPPIENPPISQKPPRALEPTTDLDETWLRLCWLVLTKHAPVPPGLSGDTFATLSGHSDLDGTRLRMGQNRFQLGRKLGEEWDWAAARVILDWRDEGGSDPERRREPLGVRVVARSEFKALV